MPEARQNNSKLAVILAKASNFRALVGMAVNVVCLCMALLSFVESSPRAYRLKASNAAPPFSTSAGTSALIEYHPGWLRPIVYHSALARYLFFNLQVGDTWQQIRPFIFGTPALAAPHYAGNTSAELDPSRVRDSISVIDAALRDLPTIVGLSSDRVLFTLDGFRYPDAAAAGKGTYYDLMRTAFRGKAESLGYEAIDLDPRFFQHYSVHGQRFEHPHDGHWNETGHAVAAEAALDSELIRRLTSPPP
jgi:hypothetical protein